jgi:long-chain acyl-CoA synthetase
MRDLARRGERYWPDKLAVVCGEHRLSYREFGARTRKLAAALRALGIGKGDRVAALMLNCHRYLEMYAACFELGAVIVPLNIRLAPPEITYIVNDAEAAALFVDERLSPLAKSVRPQLTTVRDIVYTGEEEPPVGMSAYEQLVADAKELRDPADMREEDLAGLFYTGGTTGLPKGVMLTQRNLCANALQVIPALDPRNDDIYLHSTPMFHLSGGPSAWLFFWKGATHVVERGFEPGDALRLVARERVSRVTWVPTMITMLLEHPALATTDCSSLRTITYGASAIAPDRLTRAMSAFGCHFVQAFGMTEASPVLTMLLAEEHQPQGDERALRRLLSCGRALFGVSLRVVDQAGEEAPAGVVGEVTARGANIMVGYWRKPEETAAVLKDGWYYTGDMGMLDEDGYLYIVDRKKDMIISGGENVYSIEVEVALSSHPAVLECAVIGVPDERWGEAVKAVVALRPDMQATAEELTAHCRAQLASYKCPRSVEFREALPKSGANKVLKRELRAPYWQGEQRAVN